MKVKYCVQSDIGNIRKTNQDGWLFKNEVVNGNRVVMAAVCDGMGGTERGDIAKDITIQQFSCWWDQMLVFIKNNPYKMKSISKNIDLLLNRINDKICEHIEAYKETTGTTLSLIFIINDQFIVKQIGDSRIYTMKEKELIQLTKDQATEKYDATSNKLRRYITNCLGYRGYKGAISINGNLRGEVMFLLTTDGFHEYIDFEIFQKHTSTIQENFEQCHKVISTMFNEIKEGEASDNITLLTFFIGADEHG